MNVENYIKIRVPISNNALDFRLGKGATLNTNKVCDAMILFLMEQFDLNPDCLVGDINSLYARKKEIYKKRYGEITYREYLQAKMRK